MITIYCDNCEGEFQIDYDYVVDDVYCPYCTKSVEDEREELSSLDDEDMDLECTEEDMFDDDE